MDLYKRVLDYTQKTYVGLDDLNKGFSSDDIVELSGFRRCLLSKNLPDALIFTELRKIPQRKYYYSIANDHTLGENAEQSRRLKSYSKGTQFMSDHIF